MILFLAGIPAMVFLIAFAIYVSIFILFRRVPHYWCWWFVMLLLGVPGALLSVMACDVYWGAIHASHPGPEGGAALLGFFYVWPVFTFGVMPFAPLLPSLLVGFPGISRPDQAGGREIAMHFFHSLIVGLHAVYVACGVWSYFNWSTIVDVIP